MPLSLDEVFRRIALAKGDLPASTRERREAESWYRSHVDELTRQAQAQAPGDLSITHEAVRAAIDAAYREYDRLQGSAATRRLLQGKK